MLRLKVAVMDMAKAQRADSDKGTAWLGEGWRIFRADPGNWVLLALAAGVVTVALSLIPWIGSLVFALIMPCLIGGLLLAVHETAGGRPLRLAPLIAAFVDGLRCRPLLLLGAATVVIDLAMNAITVVMMGGSLSVIAILGGGGDQQLMLASADMGLLLALLLDSLILLIWAMAMFYAIPLVVFGVARPFSALINSLKACIVNFMPLLVISVLWLLLALLATLPLIVGYLIMDSMTKSVALLLLSGYLVLVPVTVGILYASYRDIFPAATQ